MALPLIFTPNAANNQGTQIDPQQYVIDWQNFLLALNQMLPQTFFEVFPPGFITVASILFIGTNGSLGPIPFGAAGEVLTAHGTGTAPSFRPVVAPSVQTAYSVPSQRNIGVIYQNANSTSMFVTVSVGLTGSAQLIAFTDISSSPVTEVAQFQQSVGVNGTGCIGFWVLPLSWYKVIVSGGTGTVGLWTEWT